jgi:hypothetical protein
MNAKTILLATVGFVLSAPSGHAQNLLTITVTADQTKAKGSPWDGPPGLGQSRIPVPDGKNPPDLAICIVEAGKPLRCELRQASLRQLSKCQNSFTCEFDKLSVPSKPFGLIVLDLDLRRHDLVDFAVIVPDSHPAPADVETADIELHKQIEKLAPSLAESDYRTRQKDAAVLIVTQCGTGCRLTQSEIRITAAK